MITVRHPIFTDATYQVRDDAVDGWLANGYTVDPLAGASVDTLADPEPSPASKTRRKPRRTTE